MAHGSLLVVDDNPDNRHLLKVMLQNEGYTVHTAESGAAALDLYREHSIELSLVDLQMPEMDGIALLQRLRAIDPHAPVIVVTSFGSIEKAVAAMKAGALDFVTRPLRREVLLALVEKGLAMGQLVAENRRLRDEVVGKYDFSQIVAKSRPMEQVLALAGEASKRDVTVLITGESGVGKEVLARAIHYNSSRRAGPFFALNCAAISESLMESELFGHEKGAFTGADRRKQGLLEQAAKGTLLLDEIGDLPATAQAKLLRVIENREMIPVGGTRAVRIEARLIAATNADLRQRVHDRRFREDLYFRLNVLPIHIPPLRDRREDIVPLAHHVLARLSRETGRELPGFAADAIDYLMQASWDGNIRELANAIERAVIVSKHSLLTAADFPPHYSRPGAPPLQGERSAAIPPLAEGMKLEDVERTLLQQALSRSGNNLTRAARVLGMGRGALRYRLEKYGISAKE
ncbi:MAG TPA: sigma-54 dependent transcriptional regulator [Terriglobales bacterium]|nr:sigma-54 dependent transcriptional regulator [Terriglobales bacterium]